MTQIARPIQDISNVNCTDEGPVDNDGNLYTSVDEVIKDDDDSYIDFPGSSPSCELLLDPLIDPETSGNHVLHVWAKSTGGGTLESIDIFLFVGTGTQIYFANNWQPGRAAYADFNYTLTEGEANNINDYSDLRFRFREGVIGTTEHVRVTQTYFEIPDAPAAIIRGPKWQVG
jgi:hypothetical protein